MRIVATVLMLLLLAAGAAARGHAHANGLVLNAELINQSICQDSVTLSTQLRLRLRFVNTSKDRLILSKEIPDPDVIRVARNANDAARRRFEYESSRDSFPKDLPLTRDFGSSPDPKRFVVLAPGDSYEVSVQVSLFGRTDRAEGRFLQAGTHLLQVEAETWPYQWPYYRSPMDVKQVRRKWRQTGKLVTGRVESDFVPYTIPASLQDVCPASSR